MGIAGPTAAERELAELRATVAELRATLAELRAENERLQSRHRHELERQREDLNRELMRKAFKIAELEQGDGPVLSVSARTALEYEETLSWRVTKPLRALGRRMRRV